MKTDGQKFLEELANFPSHTFERRFSKMSAQLGLGACLDRNELKLLYQATVCASSCNLAFNGAGAGQRILPENEAERSRLETEFMVVRDVFWASPGWQTLSDSERESIGRRFLRVFVAEANLAW